MKERQRRKLLTRILEVQSDSGKTEAMVSLISDLASEFGYTYWEDQGNAYVMKLTDGNDATPIGIVAHTDTVHDIIENYRVFTDGTNYFGWDATKARMAGVGGDDKCGIYLAFAIAEEIPNAFLFFPRDEEIGCIGSALADMSFFDDCAFVMQGDRRGYGDVTDQIMGMDMMSPEFKEHLAPIMEEWGMKFVSGALTDVYELKCNALPVCAFNMSAGYYNPHSNQEVVNWDALEATRLFMLQVIQQMGDTTWPHTAEKKVYSYGPKSPGVAWSQQDRGALDRCLWCKSETRCRWENGIGYLCPDCVLVQKYRDENPVKPVVRPLALNGGAAKRDAFNGMLCDYCGEQAYALSFWGDKDGAPAMICGGCRFMLTNGTTEDIAEYTVVPDDGPDFRSECEWCGSGGGEWVEEFDMIICSGCMDLSSIREMRDAG